MAGLVLLVQPKNPRRRHPAASLPQHPRRGCLQAAYSVLGEQAGDHNEPLRLIFAGQLGGSPSQEGGGDESVPLVAASRRHHRQILSSTSGGA
eukprot:scaffold166179_cov35-Tisochrysis_lutea.AAC.1